MCTSKDNTLTTSQGKTEDSSHSDFGAHQASPTQEGAESGSDVGLDNTAQADQEWSAQARQAWHQTRQRYPAMGLCRR